MRTLSILLLTALLLAALLLAGPGSPAAAADTDSVGVWPLRPEPEVVTGFAPPDSPWGAGHRGVDLAGMAGQDAAPASRYDRRHDHGTGRMSCRSRRN